MAEQHRPSCAKRLRARAQREGWSVEQTVEEITSCCGVSRLRAHRLARGWTLRQAVDELHALRESDGVGFTSKLGEDYLRVLETQSGSSPRAGTVDLLCRLYRTDVHGLGVTGDYRQSEDHQLPVPRTDHVVATRSAWSPPAAAPGGLDELIEATRRSVDRTLATASVTQPQLDLLEERLLWLRQQYVRMPPHAMLRMLLADQTEVESLSSERQPAAIQVRLSEMTAVLATLIADSLMKLGRLRQAHAWYSTARNAADDSGNTTIRARVRVQAAMLPYYYGPLSAAAALAREARMLAQRSWPTAAFAAAAEARALARQGDAAAAQQAIRAAQDAFSRCEPGPEDDAFAFPERRLLLYLSGAHTFLGQHRQAREVQQQALRLYPAQTGIDPALLRLEEAIRLSQQHSLTEACQLASNTYLQVPEAHRTPILGARALHVLEVLPPAMRSARAARELSEVLAPASPEM